MPDVNNNNNNNKDVPATAADPGVPDRVDRAVNLAEVGDNRQGGVSWGDIDGDPLG